jgi:WD repeat-containing protein 40A
MVSFSLQLIVLNMVSGQMTTIPTLKSSADSLPAQQPCGIHGISVNPSGTMLATGASNTNDIGIYKLPTFDPFCVGEVRMRRLFHASILTW